MEFAIIDFVKANPVLYERQYSHSRCRHLRLQKWQELGKQLKRDPNILRMRWKGMRENYRKQMLAKSKESRDGVDSIGYGNVSKYYNHMTFLNSQYQDDDSEPETSQGEIIEEVTYDIEPVDIKPIEVEVENFDLNQYLKRHDAKLVASAEVSESTMMVSGGESSSHQSVKKKRVNKDDVIAEACEEMSQLLKGAKQHFVPPTYNQIFFNSLAMQVEQAQMPAMDQMRLQQKVLELITQELVMHQEAAYTLQ